MSQRRTRLPDVERNARIPNSDSSHGDRTIRRPRVYLSLRQDSSEPWRPKGERFLSQTKSLGQLKKHHIPNSHAICIIENFDLDLMEAATHEDGMNVHPAFFNNHGRDGFDVSSVHHYSERQMIGDKKGTWQRIDGSFTSMDNRCTRISYYRGDDFYLFLVNSPVALPPSKDKTTQKDDLHGYKRIHLSTNYSSSRQGLLLPNLLELVHDRHGDHGHDNGQNQAFDPFRSLTSSLQHKWVHNYLFTPAAAEHKTPTAISAHAMLYVLADATWQSNMKYLDAEVKRVSFDHVNKPTASSGKELHGLRQDLDFLKTEIRRTLRYVPPPLETHFANGRDAWGDIGGVPGSSKPRLTPLEYLRGILDDADGLENFLTNSLHILLASIAQRDSERADMLTRLAAVYIPLSFVTGVFGMNLRELNGSSLPIWVCFEVLAVVLILTIVLVQISEKLRVWQHNH